MDDRTANLTNKNSAVRHDWTPADVRALFALPFPELLFRAQSIHRENFDPREVQISTLLSIKTGAARKTAPIARRAFITTPVSMLKSS